MDRIPPLGAKEVNGFLNDGSYSVYLYIGKERDKGWQVAQIVHGLLPRLRAYLVEDPAELKTLLGNKKTGSVVYGWGKKKFKSLSAEQAKNLETVLKAIQDSRKGQ